MLANFLVLCCLAGSGYLIYFVVRRSQKFALDGLENHSWWERNEVAMRNEIHRTYLSTLWFFPAVLLFKHFPVLLTFLKEEREQCGQVFFLCKGQSVGRGICVVSDMIIANHMTSLLKCYHAHYTQLYRETYSMLRM